MKILTPGWTRDGPRCIRMFSEREFYYEVEERDSVWWVSSKAKTGETKKHGKRSGEINPKKPKETKTQERMCSKWVLLDKRFDWIYDENELVFIDFYQGFGYRVSCPTLGRVSTYGSNPIRCTLSVSTYFSCLFAPLGQPYGSAMLRLTSRTIGSVWYGGSSVGVLSWSQLLCALIVR